MRGMQGNDGVTQYYFLISRNAKKQVILAICKEDVRKPQRKVRSTRDRALGSSIEIQLIVPFVGNLWRI